MLHQLRSFDGLCDDALEAVISKLPTIDLIPASRVSRGWRIAVHSYLHHYPRHLPWLLLCHYLQPNTHAIGFSMHAFDPSSHTWLTVPQQCYADRHASASPVSPRFLTGSCGDRLHTLSLSKLAVSKDPFGTRWYVDSEAPKVWRQDAVLADMGRWVVVAGGGCLVPLYDGEEVRTVEVYDKATCTWHLAEPMPVQFDGSAFATWLSVAASDERLYILERKTGVASWFDPKCRKWGPTFKLTDQVGHDVSAWAIVTGPKKRLLVAGLGTTTLHQKVAHVRVWQVDAKNLQIVDDKCDEMPREMVERLFRANNEAGSDDVSWHGCSVEVCGTERGGYVYNAAEARNGTALYELEDDDDDDDDDEMMIKGRLVRRWEWVPVPERVENSIGRIEFGCTGVGLADLSSLSV